VRFDLHASELNLDELNRILNPQFRETNWLGQSKNIQASNGKDIQLDDLNLIGKLTVKRLIMKAMIATNVTAELAKDSAAVNLTNVRADVLGGKHRGNWRLEFGPKQASYEGQGTLENASLAQVAALTQDNWATGQLNATYKLKLAGTDARSLRQSVAGSADFVLKNGSVRRFSAPEFGASLQFIKWTGRLSIDSGSVEWSNSEIDSSSGRYRVSGTATLARKLQLKFLSDRHQVTISGTLDHPEITSQPATLSDSESASNQQNGNVAKGRQ
jgi:hypothetical protein